MKDIFVILKMLWLMKRAI